MIHLLFLINLLILFFGILVLVFFIHDYRIEPSRKRALNLYFYISLSILFVMATIALYYFINISSEDRAFRIYSALIFSGMILLEHSFSLVNLNEINIKPGKKGQFLLYSGMLITGLQIPALFLLPETLYWLPVFIAFVPFLSIIITIAFIRFIKRDKGIEKKAVINRKVMIAAMFILIIIAGAEVWILNSGKQKSSYYVFSLPFAYLLTSLSSLLERKKPASRLELPVGISSKAGLTLREEEIIAFVLSGKSNKEIAFELNLSENTIRNHLHRIYQKLGIQKRMDLVSLCS